MANYTRTINWETGTSKETFDRKPGLNPASWKYGLGWQDGTPTRRSCVRRSWSTARSVGDRRRRPPVAASPEDAERWQLDIWLNPPGFLKAARMPGANPKAIWRWEQIEMGRDGNVVNLEKMHVVSITMLGKYRVDATINRQNQIQRIHVMVNEPALGDFNIEQESTNQMTFGNIKWPTAWHSHQGWDDNWQFASASTGHNAYGGKFPNVQPNVCPDAVPVPANVQPSPSANPSRVAVEKMANGVYLLGAGLRTATWWNSRTGSPCSRRRINETAQPGGDRAGREAGAQQADSLAGQLARALRSHRRASHLPPHRRRRS